MKLTRRATRLALLVSAASTAPAAAALAQGAPAAPQKIVYIDSKVVLARAPGRQAAEDTFNKEMEASRTLVQKMGDSLQTMIADYQKVQATLAANVREQREAAIRKKQEDYQTRAGTLDQQMQQRQVELVKPIMDQIRKVLDDIRQEEGYAFILDAGSEGGGIVAADRNLDITEKVIARLKPVAAAPAGTGAARPASSAATKPDSSRAPAGPRSTPAGVTRPKP